MMLRRLVVLTALLAASTAGAANMTIQPDGRICYNDKCLGFYDTPAFQCEPTEHAALPAIETLEYAAARAALMEHGWTPIINFEPLSGIEKQAAEDDGFFEVEGCAGSAPVCRFGFADSLGNKLAVVWHVDHSVTAFFACED